MPGTAIRSISVQNLNIPMRESFGIAGGSHDVAHNLLLTVELEDGTRGYGEAAPMPAFNGETQDSSRLAIDSVIPRLLGQDVSQWRDLAQEITAPLAQAGSARCALETGIIDAWYRTLQRPLWSHFGTGSGPLETDMTVTIQGHLDPAAAEAHAARSAAAIAARGMKTIKTKVGGDVSVDIGRVRAIHEAAPQCHLLLDGNCGYSASQALELLGGLSKFGMRPVLFEQPVGKEDWDGLRKVSRDGQVPVAADESAASYATVRELIAGRVVDVVNIKLSKCGIHEGMQIANSCKAAGIGLMIGGMVESRLAMGTSACFAAGTGGFQFIDLDTPLFMAGDPFEGGYYLDGPFIHLDNVRAGHGITPINVTRS